MLARVASSVLTDHETGTGRLAEDAAAVYFRAMSFDGEQIKASVARLASQGVYIGTSSWKYAGWLGKLYTAGRYEYRGKVAMTRFERDCLTEYAGVFKTVCVDAAYYDFPRPESLQRLADQVPEDFRFGFKVTDAVTIKRFPNLPRFGAKAGQPNPDFLNADLFASAFLRPCETVRSLVGVLVFEFSRFWPSDYEHGRDFLADLDAFLAALPRGWPYAIELRNRHWLRPEYFDCLARHGIAHVFNAWDAMPPVAEQMALPGSRTHPDLVATRFLLKPGRKYEDAVKAFQPYDKIREVNIEVRAAGKALIAEGTAAGRGLMDFLEEGWKPLPAALPCAARAAESLGRRLAGPLRPSGGVGRNVRRFRSVLRHRLRRQRLAGTGRDRGLQHPERRTSSPGHSLPPRPPTLPPNGFVNCPCLPMPFRELVFP